MIRLIATDMDGTLLDGQYAMPSDIKAILDRMEQQNIRFVAASGRQMVNLLDLFKDDLHRVICLSNNGALVRSGDQILYMNAMTPEDNARIIPVGRTLQHGIFIASAMECAYVERPRDRNIDDYIDAMPAYFTKIVVVDDFSEVSDTILNYSVCDFRGAQTNVYPIFKPLETNYTIKVSGDSWLDISIKGNNKGRGIRAIQDHFGISKEETAAFGDFLNDAEMLDNAQFSFAMENAHPDLFAHAAFRAPSNRKNGVVRTITRLLDHPEDFT